jgi:hypothetical protein
MRALRQAAIGLAALCCGGALAGPYDGVYVPSSGGQAPGLEACAALGILIGEDWLKYYEIRCDLSNPVQIRAMDALLHDGICWIEGGSPETPPKEGRVLIRRMASGDIALVTPYMDVRLAACEVAG